MNEKNTGGPAFPVSADGSYMPDCQDPDGVPMREFPGHPGMTLRDYFAIHADFSKASFTYDQMADFLGEPAPDPMTNRSALEFSSRFLARARYAYADAMIKARDE